MLDSLLMIPILFGYVALIPVSAFGAVRMVEAVESRRRRPLPAGSALPLAFVMAPTLVVIGGLALQALQYRGSCAAWDEKDGHPCSFGEWMMLDWELGLAFALLPLIAAGIAAMLVCWHRRKLRRAG